MSDDHLFKWNVYKGAGKGDSPRPLDKEKYEQNFDRIKFPKKPWQMTGRFKKSKAGKTTWTY